MRRPVWLITLHSGAFALIAALGAVTAQAGDALLYSWETLDNPGTVGVDEGLEGWTAANATLVNAVGFGNTDGLKSMLIDNLTSGFKNDIGVATVNSGPAYDGWSQAGTRIAAGDTDVALEFDFTFDNSNGNSSTGFFMQLAIFVNSTAGGFKQYGTGGFIGGNIGSSFPTLDAAAVNDGVTMTGSGATRHLRIPMNAAVAASDGQGLTVGPPSAGGFYQVGFKSNGGWGGTVDWAIDNMRVTGANIPEPGILALASVGVAVFASRRRIRS
jgi:hypothetical protein